MSDSRVGGYPMGVTDAAIERHFGGDCKPRMCGNCRHFCGSDIHVDYGYCHLEFERAYDAEAPERKEGFWRLAKWAVVWLRAARPPFTFLMQCLYGEPTLPVGL